MKLPELNCVHVFYIIWGRKSCIEIKPEWRMSCQTQQQIGPSQLQDGSLQQDWQGTEEEEGGDEEVTLIDFQSFPPCLNRILNDTAELIQYVTPREEGIHPRRNELGLGNGDMVNVSSVYLVSVISSSSHCRYLQSPRGVIKHTTIEAPCG